jgi:hypothetical protein
MASLTLKRSEAALAAAASTGQSAKHGSESSSKGGRQRQERRKSEEEVAISPSAARESKKNKRSGEAEGDNDMSQPEGAAGEEADSSKGKGKGKKKRNNKRKGASKTINKALTSNMSFFLTIIKAILQLQQTSRTVCSTIFDVIITATELPEVVAAAAEGKKYNEMVQNPEERAQVEGPPHIYIFGAFLQAMLLRGSALGQGNHEKLKAFADDFSNYTVPERAEMIRVFRVDRTYQSAKKKVTMNIEKTPIRKEFLAALAQIPDTEHKMGRSPPTNLERELQDWVESFLQNKEG